jgi:hypothetical protein
MMLHVTTAVAAVRQEELRAEARQAGDRRVARRARSRHGHAAR